jgi:uncharacterized phiE125 gp8 family phage protein
MISVDGLDFIAGYGTNGWVGPKIPNSVQDILFTASTPVVTLAQIKSDLKIDNTDEDDFITGLITLCQAHVESYCGISCGTRTMQAVLCNHEGYIEIPYGPIQSITSIVDQNGNDLSASMETEGISFWKLVTPRARYINITYVAGYLTQNLPLDLTKAIQMEIGYRFRWRGLEAPERGVTNPGLCDDAIIFLKPFKRLRFS